MTTRRNVVQGVASAGVSGLGVAWALTPPRRAASGATRLAGVVGGGSLDMDGGEARIALMTGLVQTQEQRLRSVGYVRWTDPAWGVKGFVFDSKQVTRYQPVPDVPGAWEVQGYGIFNDSVSYPFSLTVIATPAVSFTMLVGHEVEVTPLPPVDEATFEPDEEESHDDEADQTPAASPSASPYEYEAYEVPLIAGDVQEFEIDLV
jgi:hypothetical protein